MKRYLAFALLAASLLAGCGTTPALSTNSSLTGKAAASSVEAAGKIQIFNAFKRVEGANQLRVVVMYWVRHEGKDREFRQVIVDSVATTDRVAYKTGFRPMQMVANGSDILRDKKVIGKIVDELGELNYHTVAKEQQQIVALAYAMLMDQLN